MFDACFVLKKKPFFGSFEMSQMALILDGRFSKPLELEENGRFLIGFVTENLLEKIDPNWFCKYMWTVLEGLDEKEADPITKTIAIENEEGSFHSIARIIIQYGYWDEYKGDKARRAEIYSRKERALVSESEYDARYTGPKMWLYKEYNDDFPYEEELVKIYLNRSDAITELQSRVRKYFEVDPDIPWEDIPKYLGLSLSEEETFMESCVVIETAHGTCYWEVEESCLQPPKKKEE